MAESYVIDASVVIQAYVSDTYSQSALALFEGLLAADPIGLLAPEFCLLECANILWKRARFHGLTHTQLATSLDDLLSTPLTLLAAGPYLKRAVTIGLSYQLAVYDSIYLAICESTGHHFISVDQKQLAVATALGITVKPVTDFGG